MNRKDWRKCTAEALGTFALVFVGTGSMVINDLYGGVVTHVGVALTWGLIVLGDDLRARRSLRRTHQPRRKPRARSSPNASRDDSSVPYILCQCLGALAASSALRILFPDHPTLGASLPSGGAMQSFVFELISDTSSDVRNPVLHVGSKEKVAFAGIAIGAVIALEALFAGPICGASMNPARSLAPASSVGKTSLIYGFTSQPPSQGASLAVAVATYIGVKHERHRATKVT